MSRESQEELAKDELCPARLACRMRLSGAAKILKKGRLFIEKNGQRFNALCIDMK